LLCLGADYRYLLVLGLLALLPCYPYPPYPPYPIPPKYPSSDVLLAIAELTEIFVVRMDKPIVAAIDISVVIHFGKLYPE